MCLTSSNDFKALRQKLESVRRGKGSASRLFGCKTATSTLARNCSLPAGPAGFRFTNPHNNRAEFLKLSLSHCLSLWPLSASLCPALSLSVSIYLCISVCVYSFFRERCLTGNICYSVQPSVIQSLMPRQCLEEKNLKTVFSVLFLGVLELGPYVIRLEGRLCAAVKRGLISMSRRGVERREL